MLKAWHGTLLFCQLGMETKTHRNGLCLPGHSGATHTSSGDWSLGFHQHKINSRPYHLELLQNIRLSMASVGWVDVLPWVYLDQQQPAKKCDLIVPPDGVRQVDGYHITRRTSSQNRRPGSGRCMLSSPRTCFHAIAWSKDTYVPAHPRHAHRLMEWKVQTGVYPVRTPSIWLAR
jgi:hypothetical protein